MQGLRDRLGRRTHLRWTTRSSSTSKVVPSRPGEARTGRSAGAWRGRDGRSGTAWARSSGVVWRAAGLEELWRCSAGSRRACKRVVDGRRLLSPLQVPLEIAGLASSYVRQRHRLFRPSPRQPISVDAVPRDVSLVPHLSPRPHSACGCIRPLDTVKESLATA